MAVDVMIGGFDLKRQLSAPSWAFEGDNYDDDY